MGIGRRIRELRERAGLTQEELAQLIGVTPSAVGNYERDFSHPRENVLYMMFKALNCEPNEIFSDYFSAESSPGQVHIRKYLALDEHGRELVDACTEIEYHRCCDGLTLIAARSFGNDARPRLSVWKGERAQRACWTCRTTRGTEYDGNSGASRSWNCFTAGQDVRGSG